MGSNPPLATQAIEPLPADTPWAEIDLATHALTGWPAEGRCPRCGARAVRLVSTHDSADYECRGTPTEPDADYGPARCGRVSRVERQEVEDPR